MPDEKEATKEVKKDRETPVIKDGGKAKAESDEKLSELGKQIKEHRKQQHESGKSGSTDKHGLPSAKALMGEHAHGENSTKPETALRPRDASDKGDAANTREKPNTYEKATNTLLETACQRFGKDKIESMHIKKDDMSTALSALVLGPDVCKAMGPEATANFGKRLMVFGIAPAFGMADEAQKQFSNENIKNTVHEGSANFLTGTAIGAVLEHVNPLVMGGAMLGGGALFANDQLNSPEHKERNAKISHIAGKVDTANNDDLVSYAKQTRHLIGPEAYKGVFVVATGGIGIPEGQALKTEATQALKAGVKEEVSQATKNSVKDEAAHALGKVDFKDAINNVKNMSKEALDALASILKEPHPQRRPALADGQIDVIAKPSFTIPEVPKPQSTYMKMEGKPGVPEKPLEPHKKAADQHAGSPAPDSAETKIAERIRAKAEAAEETVTKDIQGIADKFGGTMQGLEFRLKSVDSMARKIRDEGESKINDALRYTSTFTTDKLASGANQVMAEMERMGYQKERVKNTFEEGKAYVGINTTFRKDGQDFELQFHTPESLHVKETLNHKLYEVRRELDFVSNKNTGEVIFKSPEELAKVVEEYGAWLDKNYPHIGALGHMLLDEIRNGECEPNMFAHALSQQMRKHNATIPIPKDAGDVKIF